MLQCSKTRGDQRPLNHAAMLQDIRRSWTAHNAIMLQACCNAQIHTAIMDQLFVSYCNHAVTLESTGDPGPLMAIMDRSYCYNAKIHNKSRWRSWTAHMLQSCCNARIHKAIMDRSWRSWTAHIAKTLGYTSNQDGDHGPLTCCNARRHNAINAAILEDTRRSWTALQDTRRSWTALQDTRRSWTAHIGTLLE